MTGPLPKISIVTPSYNQGQFLEQTMRSVIDQAYPDLEYVLMDGGSNDGSTEIIRKFERHLRYWVSEKDKGQADAVYRGFEMCSGEILGYINSDDFYLPGALNHVAAQFGQHPEAQWLIGGCVTVDANGKKITKFYGVEQDFDSLLCCGPVFSQMSCFWKRKAFVDVGGFDRALQFCFDYDLFVRLARQSAPVVSHRMLAAYRAHGESKTSKIALTVAVREGNIVREKHGVLKIPEEARAEIRSRTFAGVKRTNRRFFLLDLFKDPIYFFRSIAAGIRDVLLSR